MRLRWQRMKQGRAGYMGERCMQGWAMHAYRGGRMQARLGGAVHVHSVRHRRIKLISMNCRRKILHFWRARLQALRLAAGGLRAPPRPNKPVDRCRRTPPSAARARSLSRPRRLIMERGTMLFTKPKHPTPTHSRTATNQARRRSEVWRSRRASSPSPAVCRH
jgi:hypothetical protein